jgi:hypothetical protein
LEAQAGILVVGAIPTERLFLFRNATPLLIRGHVAVYALKLHLTTDSQIHVRRVILDDVFERAFIVTPSLGILHVNTGKAINEEAILPTPLVAFSAKVLQREIQCKVYFSCEIQ